MLVDKEIDLEIFTKEFFSMFECIQGEIWDSIIPIADIKFREILQCINQYVDKPITRCYVEDNDNLDIGVFLSRYLEKKELLHLPDKFKSYLQKCTANNS